MNDKEKHICHKLLKIIKDLVPPANLNKQDEVDIDEAKEMSEWPEQVREKI